MIFGYGLIDSQTPAQQLQVGTYFIMMNGLCPDLYGEIFDVNFNHCGLMMQYNYLEGGDQGGPVTNVNRDQLYSIISYWDSSETREDPSVFVNVYSYMSFINSNPDR